LGAGHPAFPRAALFEENIMVLGTVLALSGKELFVIFPPPFLGCLSASRPFFLKIGGTPLLCLFTIVWTPFLAVFCFPPPHSRAHLFRMGLGVFPLILILRAGEGTVLSAAALGS
jgi:hypothetical protein